MSSFRNEDVVHNQVGGTQNIYGPVYLGTVQKGSETVGYSQLKSPDGLTEHDHTILASLAFPQMLERRNNIEAAHPATCQWILRLEEFKMWESQPRGFLWIKGKPGAGKSTVMAYLYEVRKVKRQPQGVNLDFFFSARGSTLQHTPLGLLRSLLNQLFIQAPCVRSQIRNVYDEKQIAFGQGKHNWEWQQRELEEIFRAAIITGAKDHPITMFVDALDEAGETSAREIVKYLQSIYDRVTEALVSVKFCISCRHYPIAGPLRHTEIHVEKHNSADIAVYIHDCLDLSHIEDDEEHAVWTEVETDLFERANGVFQWVCLLVQLINMKIADGESPGDVRRALQQVPEGLGDVYKFILCYVIDEKHRRASLCLFRWICFAQRPLSVTEVRYALACSDVKIDGARCHETSSFVTTDARMKLRLRALSGGLVEATHVLGGQHSDFDGGQDVPESVQVIHQSVNDFLQTQGLCLLQGAQSEPSSLRMNYGLYREDPSELARQGHQMLFRSCLLYLLTQLKQAINSAMVKREKMLRPWAGNRAGRRGSRWTIPEVRKDILINAPLTSYAVMYLFVHFEKAGKIDNENLRTQIDLIQQILLDWITMYHLIHQWDENCPEMGATLLHVASEIGLADVVRCLILSSAQVEVRDKAGNLALHIAAERGHHDVVTMLIEAGADIDARNYEHSTPLVLAAGAGHVAMVQKLLSHGSRVNGPDDYPETALCAAVYSQNSEMVKVLLAAGANINACGGNHGNTLQTAVQIPGARRKEVLQMLLAAGADINARDGPSGTVLEAAVTFAQDNKEVIRLLLDAGAYVNARGGRYGSALIAAVNRLDMELVQMLLAAGADVNAGGGKYSTALMTAAENAHMELVQLLLAAGADVNSRGGMYGTALIAAAHNRRSSTELMQVLLAAGADVNVRDEYHRTALQTALRRGSYDLAQTLRNAGASEDINQEDYTTSLTERWDRW